MLLAGLTGAALVLASTAAAVALTSELLATGDEIAHMDYAVQVSRGDLPDFYDGLVFSPPVPGVPPVQWASQHPPLYYLLLAPVVGPAADAGRWADATVLGRAVGVLLAVLAMLTTAWAAAEAHARRPALAAVVAATVVASLGAVQLVAGAVYNDVLGLVVTGAALAVSARLLRRGPTPSSLVLAGVIAAALLGTRAMLLPVVGVIGLAVLLAHLLHSQGSTAVRLARGTALAAAVGAVAVLAWGWFYLRNLRSTGSWTGGDHEWARANLGTTPTTVGELVVDPGFWRVYALVLVPREPSYVPLAGLLLAVVTVLAIVAALAPVAAATRVGTGEGADLGTTSAGPRRAVDRAVALILLLVVVLTAAVQVAHRIQGGGLQWRYVLPMLVPAVVGLLWVSGRTGAVGRGLLVLAPLALLALSPGAEVLVGAWSSTASDGLVGTDLLRGMSVVAAVGVLAGSGAVLVLSGTVSGGTGGSPSGGAAVRDPSGADPAQTGVPA